MSFRGSAADQLAIRELHDEYSDAVFRRDASDWSECWAVDARWSLMGQTVTGRDAVVSLWLTAMARFRFVAFFSQAGSLVVGSDRATGRVHTHEVLESNDGTISRTIGRYEDEYTLTDGKWLFAARAFTLLHGD